MTTANTTVVSAKLPTRLAAQLDERARRLRLTPSLLLRRLIEQELAAEGAEGKIETSTRQTIAATLPAGAFDPRADVAIELARRLDVDPSNGAQHSRELSRLLEDLKSTHPAPVDSPPTVLDEVHARGVLRRCGYGVITPEGEELSQPDPTRRPEVAEKRARDRERKRMLMAKVLADDEAEDSR